MPEKVQSIVDRLQAGFYGFWIRKWRVTFLLMAVIVFVGLYAAFTIPKESSPDIKFGIISITTVYPGVDPINMDALITQKIEKEVKDIDGVKKLSSTSSVSVSSVIVELHNDVDTSKALVDIKDAVDKASIPTEAEDPVVTEMTSENEKMFDVLLYAPADKYSYDYLKEKAERIQTKLEGKNGITKINIGGGTDYDIEVLVDRQRAQGMGISLALLAQKIRAFNSNQPLGNHRLGSLYYDFKIDGELSSINELYTLPLSINQKIMELGDIATIRKHYDDERIMYRGGYNQSGYITVVLGFDKAPGTNIFDSSASAKEGLEALLATEEFGDMQVSYIGDMSELITKDYEDLATNGGQTIILVFLAMLLFVGFKESVIAAITIPLAFFITFLVLDLLGLSLNFLTNFSLIITFGIAIDTTIVIIEGAHEKIKLGYKPANAVLLAVKDYKWALISGTTTTCLAFLPMMTLPGVLGKFLAYIPITIFTTLVAALLISLTINSALYRKLSKKKKTYIRDRETVKYLPQEERELLEYDRKDKTEAHAATISTREKALEWLSTRYEKFLLRFLKSSKTRLVTIFVPVVLLIISFMISSRIGFVLFPTSDSQYITVDVIGKQGLATDVMEEYAPVLDKTFSSLPEVRDYYFSINQERISAWVELWDKQKRKKNGRRTSFEVEKDLLSNLEVLETQGAKVEVSIMSDGPPSDKAVGIKLIAESTDQLDTLVGVAEDFEAFLHTLTGSKNVTNSNETSPGQFVFYFDKAKLANYGLTPQDFQGELYATMQGMSAGSIKIGNDDRTIQVKYDEFVADVSPAVVQDIVVATPIGPIRIGDVATYVPGAAISSVKREDTKLLITVGCDVEETMTPDKLQGPFIKFAETYKFPKGIKYGAGGENEENADLLMALAVAFVIALILIYSTLVLQFNSYLQPAIILYSVLMAMIGVNIGLTLTGNAYSLAVIIGFIALTGIVVNDAIVFVSRVNTNMERGMEIRQAVAETGKARLQPIILTTLTTILGLSSVARQDEFFAGLAYTVMFGLFMGSAMTLFVIPVLYHDKYKIRQVIRRALLSPILFISIPAAAAGIVWLLLRVLGIGMPSSEVTSILVGSIAVLYVIGYVVYTIYSRQKDGQTGIQKKLGIKIVSELGSKMTMRQVVIRFFAHWGLLLPGVGLLALGQVGLGALLLIGVLLAHFVSIWLSETNQSLHDRISKTKVIDENI